MTGRIPKARSMLTTLQRRMLDNPYKVTTADILLTLGSAIALMRQRPRVKANKVADPNHKVKLTPEEKALAALMHAQGVAVKDIAIELNTGDGRVSEAINPVRRGLFKDVNED